MVIYLLRRVATAMCRRIAEDLQRITTWFTELKIKVNIEKTVAEYFPSGL